MSVRSTPTHANTWPNLLPSYLAAQLWHQLTYISGTNSVKPGEGPESDHTLHMPGNKVFCLMSSYSGEAKIHRNTQPLAAKAFSLSLSPAPTHSDTELFTFFLFPKHPSAFSLLSTVTYELNL